MRASVVRVVDTGIAELVLELLTPVAEILAAMKDGNPTLVTPDQVYKLQVDLWSTAQVFKAGHRLRVHVTSSDFPRYDRNLNTGGPFGAESHSAVALNTVFHDAMRPSHLLLPILAN